MNGKGVVFKSQLIKKVILLSIYIIFLIANNATAQMKDKSNDISAKNQSIKIIELRNYLMKPGKRNSFITFFETNEFYQSEFWKARRGKANDLINNNDNVYLMKAVNLAGENADTAFSSNEIGSRKGLTVLDFYIANGKMDEMVSFFRKVYIPFLKELGISDFTTWQGETQMNDFPGLPVFQDKNLIIIISHFKDEKEYLGKMKQLNSTGNQKMKIALHDIVTAKTTIILFPTRNSFY